MRRNRLHIMGTVGLLLAATAGGWAATSLFQKTVPIVPGIQGCWRLEGTARQVGCLSEEFSSGADEAAEDRVGSRRDIAVISYVRRAEKLAAEDPLLAATCHPSMHDLGRREGRRASIEKRVPRFPDGSSQLCTAGYVHGLAEGYVAHDPSADVAAVFPRLCVDDDAREGCAHGIGHALLQARIGQDEPPAAAEDALQACGQLPSGVTPDCTNGVYMEMAMRTQPTPVSVEEFARTCDGDPDVTRQLSCWAYLSVSFSANDVPPADIPSWCSRAPLPAQFTCIDGYGRQLGATGVSKCAEVAGEKALQERCVEGAVGLQVGSGHVTKSEANSACRTIERPALMRHCLGAVKRYLRGRAIVEGKT